MRKTLIAVVAAATVVTTAFATSNKAEAWWGWWWPGAVVGGVVAGAIVGSAVAPRPYYPYGYYGPYYALTHMDLAAKGYGTDITGFPPASSQLTECGVCAFLDDGERKAQSTYRGKAVSAWRAPSLNRPWMHRPADAVKVLGGMLMVRLLGSAWR